MSQWSERYPYTEANVQRYAPVSGGVYRLINKSGDNYCVFYVGQSDNLQRRLLEHLAPSETNACIRRHLREYSCFFRFLEVSSSQERSRIEQEQIKEYDPTCNK
jgi:excinuclease UvrABC nuclease subunit